MTQVVDRIVRRVRTSVYSRLGRYRPDLALNGDLFHGFQDPALRTIAEHVKRTRFYRDFAGVQSWISLLERQLLYAFGRWHPGPFLEVGPWVGMSTCHIAQGIRDSGRTKRFVTSELNPTVANFRPTAEGMGFYYPSNSSENMGTCSLRDYREEIEPVLVSPGGVIGTLRQNLSRHGLDQLVEIHEGSFESVPESGFRFIFIDAMHTPTEIERNAAKLQSFLTPGTLLICHDRKCHPDNEATLRRLFRYGHTIAIDQMLIGEIV